MTIRTSQQLKALIRNLAREKGANPQLLLRTYMMERFLERVSCSDYRDNFILKGGILVTSMVGLEARSTMDIDTTVNGATVTADEVQRIVESVASIDLGDGVTFEISNILDIMSEAEYPGIRVNMKAFMDGIRVPLKIDVSTGDVITPHAIEYSYPLMFENRSIRLLAYNLETVLAEKLETIISRSTANTRMRDFYDIYILSTLYHREIQAETLRLALDATATKRNSLKQLKNADNILNILLADNDLKGLWSNYREKFNYAAGIEWSDVILSVRELAILAALDVQKPSIMEQLHRKMPESCNAPVSKKSDLTR